VQYLKVYQGGVPNPREGPGILLQSLSQRHTPRETVKKSLEENMGKKRFTNYVRTRWTDKGKIGPVRRLGGAMVDR